MKALVLVDLQNDFLPGGALGVPGGDAVLAVANAVQAAFAHVVATKDWHPADHGSFAANHPGHAVGEVIALGGLDQILWPVHCVQSTAGADFAPGFDAARVQAVFFKGTDPEIDSYSAFFDNAARRATGLGDHLRARGVEQVYLMGLATDYCVKYSALDAVKLDFETFVIEDGCRAVDLRPGDGERAFEAMRRAGVRLVQASSLVASEALAAAATAVG